MPFSSARGICVWLLTRKGRRSRGPGRNARFYWVDLFVFYVNVYPIPHDGWFIPRAFQGSALFFLVKRTSSWEICRASGTVRALHFPLSRHSTPSLIMFKTTSVEMESRQSRALVHCKIQIRNETNYDIRRHRTPLRFNFGISCRLRIPYCYPE